MFTYANATEFGRILSKIASGNGVTPTSAILGKVFLFSLVVIILYYFLSTISRIFYALLLIILLVVVCFFVTTLLNDTAAAVLYLNFLALILKKIMVLGEFFINP